MLRTVESRFEGLEIVATVPGELRRVIASVRAALAGADAPGPAGWRRIVYPAALGRKRDAASLPPEGALIVLWDGNYYLACRLGETFEYDDGSASPLTDMDGAMWLRVMPPALVEGRASFLARFSPIPGDGERKGGMREGAGK